MAQRGRLEGGPQFRLSIQHRRETTSYSRRRSSAESPRARACVRVCVCVSRVYVCVCVRVYPGFGFRLKVLAFSHAARRTRRRQSSPKRFPFSNNMSRRHFETDRDQDHEDGRR